MNLQSILCFVWNEDSFDIANTFTIFDAMAEKEMYKLSVVARADAMDMAKTSTN